jgi:hypothetical protein
MVGFDPERDNPCHGQVWGNPGNKKRRRLLRKASCYVEIAGVSPVMVYKTNNFWPSH